VDDAFGVPVRVDRFPKREFIAEARGVWPFKRIVVSPHFLMMHPTYQRAVLAHEAGHCKHFHFEKRILALPVLDIDARMDSRIRARSRDRSRRICRKPKVMD